MICLLDNMTCNIAIFGDNTSLFSTCDQALDLCRQLDVASEIELHFIDTLERSRAWLANFNAGEARLVSFDWQNNSGQQKNICNLIGRNRMHISDIF